jgi:hypothetical protein
MAAVLGHHQQQQQQEQQQQQQQAEQQQQQQQLCREGPYMCDTDCRHAVTTRTLLPQLLLSLWSSSSSITSMQSITAFFSAVATGCAAHHSMLEHLVLTLLQCMAVSNHSSSSSSAAGQQLSNTSAHAVPLVSAAVTALQAICGRLLHASELGISHPVLVSLLTQQQHLQHLQQLLRGVTRCHEIKCQSRPLTAVLLKQLLQVEEIAAQPQMTSALQGMLAAALHLHNIEAVRAIRCIMQAGTARSCLLQHGLPALLVSMKRGQPSTAWEGAWLLLHSFAQTAEGPELIVPQDCSFLLDVGLGQQQQRLQESGTARDADAVAGGSSGGSSTLAGSSLRLHNAEYASSIMCGLAGRSDAWLHVLAASSNIRLLLLGVLPPEIRSRMAGSSSTINSSSSSGGYCSQFSDRDCSVSAAFTSAAAGAAVWSDYIAEANIGTCRHLARSAAGVSAICEHVGLLLEATHNTNALEAATRAAQLLSQATGISPLGIQCVCSDSSQH